MGTHWKGLQMATLEFFLAKSELREMTAVCPDEWVSCWCSSALWRGFLTSYCEGSRSRPRSPAGTTHLSLCPGQTIVQILAAAAASGDDLEKDDEGEKRPKTTVLAARLQVFSKGMSLLWTTWGELRQPGKLYVVVARSQDIGRRFIGRDSRGQR